MAPASSKLHAAAVRMVILDARDGVHVPVHRGFLTPQANFAGECGAQRARHSAS
jgi:hypothetical protein